MADPLERLTNLVALLLDAREPLTLEQIANELDGAYPAEHTARRGAFERDKALLRGEGIPIETAVLAGGTTGYRIRRSDYELPDLGLSDDERAALNLAVSAIRLGTSWGQEALWKLGEGRSGDSGDSADVPTTTLASSPLLPALFDAQLSRSPVTFRYRGEERTLDPYGLLTRDGRWYVSGHDHARGELRTFRVDRIESDVRVGDHGSFSVPDGFDAAKHVPDDPKVIGGGDVITATVRVDRLRAGTVERELGESAVRERHDDGSVSFAVAVSNHDAFRSWLVALLDHAEVVAPQELRAEFVAWLRQVVAS
ncbi:MAG: helix-turn-helix transcriptional regulator [Acidimicrobiia bacterium]